MDHLDLEGLLSASSNWLMPAFDQQDATYLSSSRQILEPIMEETSEDEENNQNSWSQYETSVWSSESETGSVIRIELNNEQDSISERDFACPPKRPRREDFLLGSNATNSGCNTGTGNGMIQPSFNGLEDSPLRKYQRNELLSNTFDSINTIDSITNSSNNNSRKRFDEFYSDSDSLSFNSLSRSSSLIQFESLERQFLNEQVNISSSFGNSSPSLLSFDGGTIETNASTTYSNRGSTGCLKRFESSDGRLHQTYYDLDKIDFEDSLSFTQANKSDSESSDNSILSHEERKPLNPIENVEESGTGNEILHLRVTPSQRGKNSAENLSEDSGYCEHVHSVLKAKSKSIQNFEKFCEEDEFYETNSKTYDDILLHSKKSTEENKQNYEHDYRAASLELQKNQPNRMAGIEISTKIETTTNIAEKNAEPKSKSRWYVTSCEDKNRQLSSISVPSSPSSEPDELSSSVSASSSSSSSSSSSTTSASSPQSSTSPLSFTWTTSTIKKNQPKQTESSRDSSILNSSTPASFSNYNHQQFKNISSSLPDIRVESEHGSDNFDYFKKSYKNSSNKKKHLNNYLNESSEKVSSVPNDLDKINNSRGGSGNYFNNSDSDRDNGIESDERDEDYNSDDYENYEDVWSRQKNLTSLSVFASTNSENRSASRSRSPSFSKTNNNKNKTNSFSDCNTNKNNNTGDHNESGLFENINRLATTSQSARSLLIKPGGLGYMNASYSNLTLLDYSGKSRSNRSSLTMSDFGSNSKRNSREFDLGKGNFLLDEISAHFDKNASILTDRGNSSDRDSIENKSMTLPKVPPRYCVPKQTIDENNGVQHVKLTIQKPPRKSMQTIKTSNNQQNVKTFDQDPTNLKTSYADSLEKCNFDAKELSQTDLTKIPKRRFRTTQKNRGLVSSTPNLNTYNNPDDDTDDDMYVSSAHTSMHQLPTNEKRLGILLPAGSKTSFGKEVSFCPVVSKYSWQEQSSEEYNEPSSIDPIHIDTDATESSTICTSDVISSCYDVTDAATTKTKHTIVSNNFSETNGNGFNSIIPQPISKPQTTILDGEKIKGEHRLLLDSVSPKTKASEKDNNKWNDEIENVHTITEGEQIQKKQLLTTSMNIPSVMERERNNTSNTETVTTTKRYPAIEHGTIVVHTKTLISNCAYAGKNDQNLSDRKVIEEDVSNENKIKTNQRQSANNCAEIINVNINPSVKTDQINLKTCSDKNLNKNLSNKMANVAIKCSTTKLPTKDKPITIVGGGAANKSGTNNNNELMNSKFENDRHKTHKGFLSRFANGFRFSLRRKKNKYPIVLAEPEMVNQNGQKKVVSKSNSKKSVADGAVKSKQTSRNSPDFIYIPLKGPLPTKATTEYPNAINNDEPPCNSCYSYDNDNRSIDGNCCDNKTNRDNINHVLITGKPPLPKQPPRVVGVCEKMRAGQHAQNNQLTNTNGTNNNNNNNNKNIDYTNGIGDDLVEGGNSSYYHHHRYRSSSQPREIDVDDESFLENERSYYEFKNQFNGIMNSNGCRSTVAPILENPKSAMIINNTKNNINYNHHNYNNVNNIGNKNGQKSSNCKIGLIETNLDTHETVISGKTRSLMELGPQIRYNFAKHNASGYPDDLDDADDSGTGGISRVVGRVGGAVGSGAGNVGGVSRRPHKSMEFLLDKENQRNVLPPENELQKSHDSTAALSEHQLRVQASLQRLNIPDWYQKYNQSTPKSNESSGYKPGNFSRKRTSDSGRWTGLNSKTTSLSSLGSQRSDRSPLLLSPSAHSHHGGHTNVGAIVNAAGGCVSGTGSAGGFSRWSTSYLNSTQTSPSVSTRGSFSRGGPINSSFISASGASVRGSFRQPYMGWRSQEKLSQPRTPHERLALSLLSQKSTKTEPAVTPEIQSSIKEVTSAIVHYVNDQTNRTPRSRSASPNSRKCWLESSFVGVRPVESPETPVIDNKTFSNNNNQAPSAAGGHSYNNHYNFTNTSSMHANLTADLLRMNGVERSTSSASLEDVLASLLGLPPTNPVPDTYRSTGDSTVASKTNVVGLTRVGSSATPSTLQVQDSRFRRHSEGDAQKRQQQQQTNVILKQQSASDKEQTNEQEKQQQNEENQSQHQTLQPTAYSQILLKQINQQTNQPSETSLTSQPSRRVSLDSSDSKTASELVVKCRNTKCDQSAPHGEAKKHYKSCHNCSHLYCTRECRRAHWEKHRKACLHSRVSNLCRQVLSACKDDVDTLRHLSLLARKGYLSQGRGVVRILFRSPESAEGFIKTGFQCIGEASYVRWPDLMPAEMGLELYSELLRLSTEYKPDSKMLIYVAICVVSEAPSTATATVKWERQLVSRCAKLKLCRTILTELDQMPQQMVIVPETATEILILTFNPQKRATAAQREIILTNITTMLNRRGVILRKHYPETYQRLQTFAEGQTDRFSPVTLHPRDNQTGQGFVCIIMPVMNDGEVFKMPGSDIGNRVTTIDVGEDFLES